MEMNRMKEENKMLRKEVEQTMKDYYDLEMKIAIIQQNNLQKKVPKTPILVFFNINTSLILVMILSVRIRAMICSHTGLSQLSTEPRK